MGTLVLLTGALLNKGLDYEVTLKDSTTTVRLFDQLTQATLGTNTSETVEQALATVLADIASDSPRYDGLKSFDGLTRL